MNPQSSPAAQMAQQVQSVIGGAAQQSGKGMMESKVTADQRAAKKEEQKAKDKEERTIQVAKTGGNS